VKPDTPEIQALLSAYNTVTGEDAKPFTIGGGTYAREFTSGASFGPEMPWIKNPAWVGGIHGPDEGVQEEQLKTALKVYALALYDLEQLKLG
ncbi:MAG: M20/M25/M40 family metallo-hydrolase, partial [Eggerthellaceae bacterium]|nr:M20/M25/M40 family metallo-hydrolase [Eggerthellaceae bacterium]